MEPIAGAPVGSSLQVPTVQRFYTPYMARPASATIPVAPPALSPPHVFRSPSQPAMPRTSVPALAALSPALQRAATASTTPATSVRSSQPVYAVTRQGPATWKMIHFTTCLRAPEGQASCFKRSVTAAPYTASAPGYPPPATVLVSPQPTMRVVEPPREARPSVVPSPWAPGEPITSAAMLRPMPMPMHPVPYQLMYPPVPLGVLFLK